MNVAAAEAALWKAALANNLDSSSLFTAVPCFVRSSAAASLAHSRGLRGRRLDNSAASTASEGGGKAAAETELPATYPTSESRSPEGSKKREE